MSRTPSSRHATRAPMESAGAMIAFHLSVPYGPDIVSEQDVYHALKHGSLAGIASPAKDILVSLFIENSPASLLKAAYECGSSLENLRKLYEEIRGLPFPPSPEWERMTCFIPGDSIPRIGQTGRDRSLASGSWKDLEERAARIVSDAEATAGIGRLSPLLGGGTRLMLALNHRISRDIDLYIRDPQWIGLLSPRSNDKVGDLVCGYEEDATFLELRCPEGKIQFIVRMSLTGLPPESSEKSLFLLEPVEEVLAKKLFYRGAFLRPRDLFDWFCIESMHPEALDPTRIARVIKSRLEGLHRSLERMESEPSARRAWEQLETPLELDFDKAIAWGKGRLEDFRDLSLTGKEQQNLQRDALQKEKGAKRGRGD